LNNYEIQRSYQTTVPKLDKTESYSLYTIVNENPVFIDDPKAIGVKKNGYGWETARIYLVETVGYWIKDAFDQELKSAGFIVEDKFNAGDIKIVLNVLQFFVEPWVGVWTSDLIGTLKIQVEVHFPNKEVFYVRKFTSYDKSTTMVWPDGMFEDKIINVAQGNIPQIVKEIHYL
jgi:hypothetical protein